MYKYYVSISLNNILLLGHACQNFQCNTLHILGHSGPDVYPSSTHTVHTAILNTDCWLQLAARLSDEPGL